VLEPVGVQDHRLNAGTKVLERDANVLITLLFKKIATSIPKGNNRLKHLKDRKWGQRNGFEKGFDGKIEEKIFCLTI
jgi:hypothetical protein